jgi:hypothetical protein
MPLSTWITARKKRYQRITWRKGSNGDEGGGVECDHGEVPAEGGHLALLPEPQIVDQLGELAAKTLNVFENVFKLAIY